MLTFNWLEFRPLKMKKPLEYTRGKEGKEMKKMPAIDGIDVWVIICLLGLAGMVVISIFADDDLHKNLCKSFEAKTEAVSSVRK